MNWFVKARTSRKVGFQQDGHICEGGNCEHLKEGDQAYGYSGEADSFGEEHYLMCEPCFVDFLAKQRVEPTECSDCSKEFPRNELTRYIPYVLDGSPSENEDAKRWLCKCCVDMPRHQNRLKDDEFYRQQDDDSDGYLD